MGQWLWAVLLVLLAGSATGCAYVEERFHDDTNNPNFETGYRQRETYRLRADGQVVAVWSNGCLPHKATERLELWSPRVVARNAEYPDFGRVVGRVPAGTLVRVDGREHNYTFAIPPVPGDTQILRAYGTVDGTTGRWSRVRIPHDQDAKPSFVPGTYVLAFPPDDAFLEWVPPVSAPAP